MYFLYIIIFPSLLVLLTSHRRLLSEYLTARKTSGFFYSVLLKCACVVFLYYDLLLLAAPKECHLGLRVDSPCCASDLHRVEVWFGLHHIQTSLRNCKTQTNRLSAYISTTLHITVMDKRADVKLKLWSVFSKDVLISKQRYRLEVFTAIELYAMVYCIIKPFSSPLGSYTLILRKLRPPYSAFSRTSCGSNWNHNLEGHILDVKFLRCMLIPNSHTGFRLGHA
jgi:hypothetical protein